MRSERGNGEQEVIKERSKQGDDVLDQDEKFVVQLLCKQLLKGARIMLIETWFSITMVTTNSEELDEKVGILRSSFGTYQGRKAWFSVLS